MILILKNYILLFHSNLVTWKFYFLGTLLFNFLIYYLELATRKF